MRWAGVLAGFAVLAVASAGPAEAVRPLPAHAGPVADALGERVSARPAEAVRAVPSASMVRAIVVLNDQVDPESVRGSAPGGRGAALERELRARADAGQRGLLELLRVRRSQGSVSAVHPLWILNAVAVTAAASVLPELAARPEVREIRPDPAIPAPRLVASAEPAEPNLALVDAPALWDLGHRGRGVVVAGLDTGVDATHPDLAGRYRGGGNSWYDPNGEHPSTPVDVNGHGTATMGVMVGGDAGGTAVGVAPEATWIAAKIFNDRGVATASGIHLAMQWLLDPDGDPETADAPDVVNNSWEGTAGGCDPQFQPDLRVLRAVGILPVFAAGNQGPLTGSVRSPADSPEAFAVGATDAADVVAPFSGRGPSACAGATAPQLVAPGVDVRTTDRYGLYTTVSGTSLAAPHVAGALALLLGAYPGLDADRQAAALRYGALDLGPPGPDGDHGYGRLDVLAAYRWLATAPDFTMEATPRSRTAVTGGTATYTVTVAAMNGFTGPVAFSVSGLPPGAVATWEPPGVTGSGGSRLTVSAPAGVTPGTYPLEISGGDGTLTHSVRVTLVVTAGDFALSASPAVLSVARGGSAVSTVSLPVSGAFTGNVALAVTGLPAGSTAGLSANPVGAPGTSRLTVRTTSSTPRGTFTPRVTGTYGPLTHAVFLTLTVR